jgi:hypothetical protein
MLSRKTTVRSAFGFSAAGLGFIFRDVLSWIISKILDQLPIPKNQDGSLNMDAIPWADGIGIGLIIFGVFLFWKGGRMQNLKSTKKASGYELSNEAYKISQYIAKYRSTSYLFRSDLPDLKEIIREGAAAFASYQKAGFSIPNFDTHNAYCIAIGMEHYFGSLAPLLKKGHEDVAREFAPSVAKTSEDLSLNFEASRWWTKNDW